MCQCVQPNYPNLAVNTIARKKSWRTDKFDIVHTLIHECTDLKLYPVRHSQPMLLLH